MKNTSRKLVSLLAVVGVGAVLTLAGCTDKKEAPAKAADGSEVVTLVVGASPVPHSDILKQVEPELAKEGVKLKVIEFSDYIKPNLALQDKELDANFFQHVPYMEEFCKAHGCKLKSLAAVHLEPMGVYSRKVKSLSELGEGAVVAIPNDPTNGGRALMVLQHEGLIKLRPDAGILATAKDVVENPKHVVIRELEAAQLPRSLDDVDAAVINSNYAIGAKLNPVKDAIAIEDKNSPYANIVAVRADDDRPALKKFKAALLSEKVKKYLEDSYQGAVLPAF